MSYVRVKMKKKHKANKFRQAEKVRIKNKGSKISKVLRTTVADMK